MNKLNKEIEEDPTMKTDDAKKQIARFIELHETNINQRVEQADRDLDLMWEHCRSMDWKWAEYFRRRTALRFICIPGNHGAAFVKCIYKLAHCVVRFN